jgi:transcriptional regulator with PAS, ATPase and Fis domain
MSKKPIYEELLKRVKQLKKNVAESKRVAKDFEQEKKFSEKVLSSLPGIFYLYDEDGNNVRWNRNHEILTGFSAEEISERKILDWFDEDEKKYIASTETQDSESDEASKAFADKKFISFKKATENFEKNLLAKALETNRWHREKTAASLELSPRTFYRKIKKFGL